MKNLKFLVLATLFIASNSYGFCVYNHTQGYDTLDASGWSSSHVATVLEFSSNGKFDPYYRLDQGGVKCDIGGPRGQNDMSEINVFYVSRYVSPANYNKKSICNLNVYNKGGYVEIYGNQFTGFSCVALRD